MKNMRLTKNILLWDSKTAQIATKDEKRPFPSGELLQTLCWQTKAISDNLKQQQRPNKRLCYLETNYIKNIENK